MGEIYDVLLDLSIGNKNFD